MAYRLLLLMLMLVAATACASGSGDGSDAGEEAPLIIQPGAPGEDSRVLSPDELAALARVAHTEADVRFMQEMIPHHAQAIEMADLVEGRSTNEQLHSLALRIEISQADEIGSMQSWLLARGEEPPDLGDGHAHMMGHAPGMLSAEQMAELAAAEGAAFDALFLRFMIQHHDGALMMVRELMATSGAAQESRSSPSLPTWRATRKWKSSA